MKVDFLIAAVWLANSVWAACNDNADGFASLNGGTTGGNGGTVVTVTNQADLERYAGASGKYVIKIPGRIIITPKGKEVSVANDKTIIGEGAAGEISGGGFNVQQKKNIIFRNLRIGGTTGGDLLDWDGIQVDTSSNIWIDHCIFENIGDGGVDLRKDTNYFTVSNTIFRGIDKAFGIGWTENTVSRGTMHHNYFDGTNQRGPSAGGLLHAHLYNNYLRGVTSYGHYARGPTSARIENCYFENTKSPVMRDPEATLRTTGSVYSNCSGRIDADFGTVFNPRDFYSYTLHNTNDVPAYVRANAGPLASVCPRESGTNPPPTTTPPPPSGCTSPIWNQCGGTGYTGCRICASGTTCLFINEWYSQCLPN